MTDKTDDLLKKLMNAERAKTAEREQLIKVATTFGMDCRMDEAPSEIEVALKFMAKLKKRRGVLVVDPDSFKRKEDSDDTNQL